MIATIVIATGRLFESQDKATPETMLKNAKSAGFTAAEVEIRQITPAEHAAFLAMDKPTPDDLARREVMSPAIQAVVEAVLERQQTTGRPVVPADKDVINARAIELRKGMA